MHSLNQIKCSFDNAIFKCVCTLYIFFSECCCHWGSLWTVICFCFVAIRYSFSCSHFSYMSAITFLASQSVLSRFVIVIIFWKLQTKPTASSWRQHLNCFHYACCYWKFVVLLSDNILSAFDELFIASVNEQLLSYVTLEHRISLNGTVYFIICAYCKTSEW